MSYFLCKVILHLKIYLIAAGDIVSNSIIYGLCTKLYIIEHGEKRAFSSKRDRTYFWLLVFPFDVNNTQFIVKFDK